MYPTLCFIAPVCPLLLCWNVHVVFRSDITVCWLVAEVAIAAAYVLLMTVSDCADAAHGTAEDQALQAVSHLLVGAPVRNAHNLRCMAAEGRMGQDWWLCCSSQAGRVEH